MDYYFWFSNPSTILSFSDYLLAYIFAGSLVLSVALWVIRKLSANPIVKKILNKFFSLFFSTGLTGLIWFAFRYENTQIFGKRLWAGLTLLIGLLWLLWILKYALLKFRTELLEYHQESIRSKYIPKKR